MTAADSFVKTCVFVRARVYDYYGSVQFGRPRQFLIISTTCRCAPVVTTAAGV